VTAIGIAGAGLLAGALHVYLGPDHLAALAVMSLRSPSRAWRLGLRWGLGHTGGVLAVAALVFSFRELFEVERLSQAGEILVGITLIVLGLWGIRRRRPSPEPTDDPGHSHGRAAFLVGTLHGAAGTSHLLGILPSLALPTTGLALVYLGAFGLATVAAMAFFSGMLGLAGRRCGEHRDRNVGWMVRSASVVSILVGTAWIVLPLAGISLA
jgi:hypothetical protein